jgi:hypothetical protein
VAGEGAREEGTQWQQRTAAVTARKAAGSGVQQVWAVGAGAHVVGCRAKACLLKPAITAVREHTAQQELRREMQGLPAGRAGGGGRSIVKPTALAESQALIYNHCQAWHGIWQGAYVLGWRQSTHSHCLDAIAIWLPTSHLEPYCKPWLMSNYLGGPHPPSPAECHTIMS